MIDVTLHRFGLTFVVTDKFVSVVNELNDERAMIASVKMMDDGLIRVSELGLEPYNFAQAIGTVEAAEIFIAMKYRVYCHRCGAEIAEHEDFGAEMCDNCQSELDGEEPQYVSFDGYTFLDSEYEEA